MRDALHWANATLAFLLEVAALVALGYWGFHTGAGIPAKLALGLGAPLLAAIVWGLFAAPKARFAVPFAAVLATKALVFGAATAALYATGHRVPAVVFAIVVVFNTTTLSLGRRAGQAR